MEPPTKRHGSSVWGRSTLQGLSLVRAGLKEWRGLRRQGRMPLAIPVTLGLVSGGLLVILLTGFWQRQARSLREQGQVEVGLLALRLQGHGDSALDWGKWDPTHNFIAGRDPGFLQRELHPSSMVHDGQSVLITNAQLEVLEDSLSSLNNASVSPQLARSIRQCLQQTLRTLDARVPQRDNTVHGLLCRTPATLVLGAATRVTPTDESVASNGWLVHYSLGERPSYKAELNGLFRRIRDKVALEEPGEQTWPSPFEEARESNLSDFSEGLPRGLRWQLRQPINPLALLAKGFSEALVPWIVLNLLVLAGGVAFLANGRRSRFTYRQEQRRNNRRLQDFRLLDGRRDLPTLPAFLALTSRRVDQQRRRRSGTQPLLGEVVATIQSFASGTQNSMAMGSALVAHLYEGLKRELPEAKLCRTPDNSLVLLIEADDPRGTSTLGSLEGVIDATIAAFSGRARLMVRAALVPLDQREPEQQLSDLSVFNSRRNDDRTVLMVGDGDEQVLQAVREQISRDFQASSFAEQLREVTAKKESVVHIRGSERSVAYRELLFRFPPDSGMPMPIQELILALERNNTIHHLDLLMVREALNLIECQDRPHIAIGANLSALTVSSIKHRQELLALLQGASPAVLSQLILEVTETAIIGDPLSWKGFLTELADLGVKVAIDDFGVGYASLSHLFEFHADFIKVDMKYTHRVDNPEVNAMVRFLLSFEPDSNTRVVMEGIETEEQLRHWLGQGVSHFQGYLFSPNPNQPGSPDPAAT